MTRHENDWNCEKCGIEYLFAFERDATEEELEEMPWIEDGIILDVPTTPEQEKESTLYAGEPNDSDGYSRVEDMTDMDLGIEGCKECEAYLRKMGYDDVFDWNKEEKK